MTSSNLSAYSPIPDGSEATPGLWDSRMQQLQDNIVSVESRVTTSDVSNYVDYLSVGTNTSLIRPGSSDPNFGKVLYRGLVVETGGGRNPFAVYSGNTAGPARERFSIENNQGAGTVVDMNIRNSTLNIGDVQLSVSSPSQIIFSSETAAFFNVINVRQPGITSANAFEITNTGQVDIYSVGRLTNALLIQDVSSNTAIFRISGSTAELQWSDGTVPYDVSLSRLTGSTLSLTGRLRMQQEATPATPTLQFGDGDTGFYEHTDDEIRIALGGTDYGRLSNLQARLGQDLTDVAAIDMGAVASSTNPVFMFNGDTDTGIGRAGADQLSLIAGGTEAIRLSDGTVRIPSVISDVANPTGLQSGNTGDISISTLYLSICVSANSWRRISLTAF